MKGPPIVRSGSCEIVECQFIRVADGHLCRRFRDCWSGRSPETPWFWFSLINPRGYYTAVMIGAPQQIEGSTRFPVRA